MNKTRDLIYIALSAALITICAWIVFPTAVPFTMQTFAVALTSAILGTKKGALAVVLYILLGLAGLPVFSGFRSGIGTLGSVTGGYIIGFVFTAFITGWGVKKVGYRPLPSALFMALGVTVCYAFGTLWYVALYTAKGGAQNIWAVLTVCVFPFVIPDCLKITLAAVVAKRIKKAIK